MIGFSRLGFRGIPPTITETVTALPALAGAKVSRLDAARVDVNAKRMARLIHINGDVYLVERDAAKGVSIYQWGDEIGYRYDQDLQDMGFRIDESFVPDNLTEAIG